jgi:hypothetical protein
METYMELSKKTTILLTREMHLRLTELASSRGVSLGKLIREACRERYGLHDPEQRVSAARELAAMTLPVADPAAMKRESVPEPEDLLP